jgi:hypothetical protein
MGALNIAMVGARFMGKAHSHGWRTVPQFSRRTIPERGESAGRARLTDESGGPQRRTLS